MTMSAMKLYLDVLKAAASKQEVIEGAGEGENSCIKDECIVKFGMILKKLHLIKPFGISLKSHHMLQHMHHQGTVIVLHVSNVFLYTCNICISMLHY